MDFARVATVSLHTLAIVIVLGYYAVLGRIVLPALRRSIDAPGVGRSLVATERRARPLLLISVAVFAVTGMYLMVVDEQYAGLGVIGGSAWTPLILLKHLVIAAFIGLAIVVDRLIDGLAGAGEDGEAEGPSRRTLQLIGLAADGATLLGAIIIVITAAAQFSAP